MAYSALRKKRECREVVERIECGPSPLARRIGVIGWPPMRRLIINPIAFLCGALALALGDSAAGQPAAPTSVYDITAAPFGCTASASAGGADDSTCLQAAIDAAWGPAAAWSGFRPGSGT